MKLETFIFIGWSGCGKGTQVALLQEYVKKQDHKRRILYIETGERFRQFIKEHSLSSRLAAEIYKAGNRQPDFIAVWMWSHLLVEEMTGEEHLIFDGTPRSLHEAQIIDTAITFYNRQRPHVIYLNISRETSKARMIARRRMDDINEEEIERRLNWFESDVLPAVEYFRKYSKYTFIELDGDQPVEAVQQELLLKVFG
ncbi:MAG TPA: nucleoside monophosphate kinase [Chthoniobacterales bacterium]